MLQEEDEASGKVGWVRVRIRELRENHAVAARAVDDLSAKVVPLVDGIEPPLPTTRLRPLRAGR